MNVSHLKAGFVKKFQPGYDAGNWKNVYLTLSSDSRLSWFDHPNDAHPLGHVMLKDVIQYICVGEMIETISSQHPILPQNVSIDSIVAIGTGTQGEHVHWFLFNSDEDVEAWFSEVIKTLPTPVAPANPADYEANFNEPPPSYDSLYPNLSSSAINTHNTTQLYLVGQRQPVAVSHYVSQPNNRRRRPRLWAMLFGFGIGSFFLARRRRRRNAGGSGLLTATRNRGPRRCRRRN